MPTPKLYKDYMDPRNRENGKPEPEEPEDHGVILPYTDIFDSRLLIHDKEEPEDYEELLREIFG